MNIIQNSNFQASRQHISQDLFMKIRNTYKKQNKSKTGAIDQECLKNIVSKMGASEQEDIKNITSEQLNVILGLKKPDPETEVHNALLYVAIADDTEPLRETSPLTDKNLQKTISFITNKLIKNPSINLPSLLQKIIQERGITSAKRQFLLHSISIAAGINAANKTSDKDNKVKFLKDALYSNCEASFILGDDKDYVDFTKKDMVLNMKEYLDISKQMVENKESDDLVSFDNYIQMCDECINLCMDCSDTSDKSDTLRGIPDEVFALKTYFMENKGEENNIENTEEQYYVENEEEYEQLMSSNNYQNYRCNKRYIEQRLSNFFQTDFPSKDLKPLKNPLIYQIPEEADVKAADRILIQAFDIVNTGFSLTDELINSIVDELLKNPGIDFCNLLEEYLHAYNVDSTFAQVALFNICRCCCWQAAEKTKNDAYDYSVYKASINICGILQEDAANNNEDSRQFAKGSRVNSYLDTLLIAQKLLNNNYPPILDDCEFLVELCNDALNHIDNPDEKYKVLLYKVGFLKAAKKYDKAAQTLTEMKNIFPEKAHQLDKKIKKIENRVIDDDDRAIMVDSETAEEEQELKSDSSKENRVIDDADRAIMVDSETAEEEQDVKSDSSKENRTIDDADIAIMVDSETVEEEQELKSDSSKENFVIDDADSSSSIHDIFDENIPDTITLKAEKRLFHGQSVTIEIPNTNKANTLYTRNQYTLPDKLKFKPLGIRSLSKAIAANQIIPGSLICLNNSKEKPLYAMELTDKAFESSAEFYSLKNVFSVKNVLGQKRMIYTEKDRFEQIRHYIILDEDISKHYAHNNVTDRFIRNSEIMINPGEDYEQEKCLVTDRESIISRLSCGAAIVFSGNMIGEDFENALNILNLPEEQLYETDVFRNVYYTDSNGEKIHTGINLTLYPDDVTLSLINYQQHENDVDLSSHETLRKTIEAVNDGDTAQNRARFFFEDGTCYFTTNQSRLSKDRTLTIKDIRTLYNS